MAKEPTGFDADFFVPEGERDPVKASRDPARPLPKRFYKEASAAEADGGFAVLLDGRPVNTPARRRVVVPWRPLAEALAGEWAAQGETIDLRDIPDEIRSADDSGENHSQSRAGLAGVGLDKLEKEAIRQTLAMTAGNREQAAQMLGIGERTLYRKLKEYGLR